MHLGGGVMWAGREPIEISVSSERPSPQKIKYAGDL